MRHRKGVSAKPVAHFAKPVEVSEPRFILLRMDYLSTQPNRVSMQDIADELGISKATVCRALLGRQRVSEETKSRVRMTAKRLGYRSDAALSALNKHRWAKHTRNQGGFSIAVISARGGYQKAKERKSNIENHPDGIAEAAAEQGIRVETYDLDNYANPLQLGRQLYHRGIDGILVSVDGRVSEWDFPFEKFYCTTINYDGPSHRLHAVVPDWFNVVPTAVNELLKRGYRRIGFASFTRFNPAIDSRLMASILLAQRKLESEFGSQPNIFEYSFNQRDTGYKTGIEPFEKWYRQEQPEVIVDNNHLCCWWCYDLGIQFPEDCGYVTLNGPGKWVNESGLANVSLHRRMIGRAAVEMLSNLMQLNIKGVPENPTRIVVPCQWYDGGSIRAESVSRDTA